jgi:hypothetical protein
MIIRANLLLRTECRLALASDGFHPVPVRVVHHNPSALFSEVIPLAGLLAAPTVHRTVGRALIVQALAALQLNRRGVPVLPNAFDLIGRTLPAAPGYRGSEVGRLAWCSLPTGEKRRSRAGQPRSTRTAHVSLTF